MGIHYFQNIILVSWHCEITQNDQERRNEA